MKKNPMNRRSFLKTAGVTLGSVGLNTSFFIPEIISKENDLLKIGYLPITDSAPLLIAYAKGYFRDEGLPVAKPRMIRNWSSLVESFQSGKFNLVHLLFPIPLWMRYRNKSAVKVIAWDHTNGSAITVGRDSDIKSFADLGGKQIAVPYWYSMHNMILQMGLKKVGLEPVIQPQSAPLKPNQVNLFILPPSEMPLALAGRKIDGFIVAEPFNALAELQIKAKIMRFVGDIWKNHPCCVCVMQEKTVQQKPVYTAKVVNAIARAQSWLSNNRAEAAKLLSKSQTRLLPHSEKVLRQALMSYDSGYYAKGAQNGIHAIQHPDWGIDRIGFQPYPYPSATRLLVNQMRETLVEGNNNFLQKLNPDFVTKDLVDASFAKQAVMSLGGPDKFSGFDLTSPWDREEMINFGV